MIRATQYTWRTRVLTITLALAVLAYWYGLDGAYIPTNGDELVYAHITRLTAASADWLPLHSVLDGMRNTKPPLLFWQGILSSHDGHTWDLWHLRYPSVVYTLLTAGMVLALARKLSGRWQAGLVAATSYLAFFSTYRYGRPFLTNAPETFWLFLPGFILLYWGKTAFMSRLWVPIGLGVCIGIGLLYKSFFLLLPVVLVLSYWYWQERCAQLRLFLQGDVYKLALIGTVALALFSLWFVFDPEPRAIWNEFVLGENIGKLEARGESYLQQMLWGSSSLWTMGLGYPVNAGLLIFPVFLLLLNVCWRYADLSAAEQKLCVWVFVFLFVFSLPSQRSARYLLDAMPALAVMYALRWETIHRGAFIVSLCMCALLSGGLFFLTQQIAPELFTTKYDRVSYALLTLTAFGVIVAGLTLPGVTRALTHMAVCLVYLLYSLSIAPFDKQFSHFGSEAIRVAQGQKVGVPCNFRANFEQYQFALPNASISGYSDTLALDVKALSSRYPLFVIRTPVNERPCSACEVIGHRLEFISRHTSGQIDRIWQGELYENLLVKAWLIRGDAKPGLAPLSPAESCR